MQVWLWCCAQAHTIRDLFTKHEFKPAGLACQQVSFLLTSTTTKRLSDTFLQSILSVHGSPSDKPIAYEITVRITFAPATIRHVTEKAAAAAALADALHLRRSSAGARRTPPS